MKEYEISITVKEFLELIPVISKELDLANKNLQEAHVIINEIEKTRVQNIDILYGEQKIVGGKQSLFKEYNNSEISRIKQKVDAFSSILDKLEKSMIRNFTA